MRKDTCVCLFKDDAIYAVHKITCLPIFAGPEQIELFMQIWRNVCEKTVKGTHCLFYLHTLSMWPFKMSIFACIHRLPISD